MPTLVTLGAAMLMALLAVPARVAEVRVLSAAAVQEPVEAIATTFTADSGHRLVFEFVTAGQVDARLSAGATPDIVITTSERAARLGGSGDGARRRLEPLGTVGMGVAVRRGAATPDLSSVDGFTSALRRASSVAYADPAGGGTTGIYFARLLEQLRIVDEMRPKAVLSANGLDVVRRVSSGSVELGVTQISEILHVDAATFVGPLPEAVQLQTTYVALLRGESAGPAAAFLGRLIDAAGRERFRAAGFR